MSDVSSQEPKQEKRAETPPAHKRSHTRSYVYGLATNYATQFATILVGLWMTPFTLRYLDREQYALFTLASDLLVWFALFDLGITATIGAQAARMSGQLDMVRLNRLTSTAFAAQNLIALLIGLVGGLIALFFPHFFQVRPDLVGASRWMAGLLVGGTILAFATQVFSALLVAHHQQHIDNLIKLTLVGVRTALTFFLLKAGWGMLSLAVASITATLITTSMAVWRCYRLLPGLRLRWQEASWGELKGILNLSIWFTLSGITSLVQQYGDRILSAKIVSVEMVTTLLLTGRLYTLVWGMLIPISTTARPTLAKLLGQDQLGAALRAYRSVFLASTGVAMLAAATLWSGNRAFITWWVGSSHYGGIGLDTAQALNLVVMAWLLPSRAVLNAGLKAKEQTAPRITESVLAVLLALFLGKTFGLVGVVLGAVIAATLTTLWYMPLLVSRLFHQPFGSFFRAETSPLLLLGVCLLPVAGLGRYLGESVGGLGGAISAMAFTGSVGGILVWTIALDADERERFRSKLGGGRKSRKPPKPEPPSAPAGNETTQAPEKKTETTLTLPSLFWEATAGKQKERPSHIKIAQEVHLSPSFMVVGQRPIFLYEVQEQGAFWQGQIAILPPTPSTRTLSEPQVVAKESADHRQEFRSTSGTGSG